VLQFFFAGLYINPSSATDFRWRKLGMQMEPREFSDLRRGQWSPHPCHKHWYTNFQIQLLGTRLSATGKARRLHNKSKAAFVASANNTFLFTVSITSLRVSGRADEFDVFNMFSSSVLYNMILQMHKYSKKHECEMGTSKRLIQEVHI